MHSVLGTGYCSTRTASARHGTRRESSTRSAAPPPCSPALDLDEALERLYADVLRHTGGELADDSAALLLTRAPR